MALASIDDFFGPLPGGGAGSIYYGGRPLPNVSSSTGKDEGTVERLATLLSGGITKHASTAQLVANLKPFRGGTIVGHGNYAYFETGAGKSGYSDNTVVEYDNEYAWHDEIAKLWKPAVVAYDAGNRPHYSYGSIWIYACCVAGGPRGTAFLQKLADLTNCSIIAYTGLIYVFSTASGRPVKFTYERGHTLVQVWPTGAARKNLSDKSSFSLDHLNKSDISLVSPLKELFNIDGSKTELFLKGISPNNINSISINLRTGGKFVTKQFGPEYVETILKSTFYSKTFQKSGDVAGIITAIININYIDQPALTTQIFSDKMAEKLLSGESCMVSPDFRQTMDQIFSI